jgi:hypothetical protein
MKEKMINKNYFSHGNLKRIIKLRNILKYKVEDENLAVLDINKFKAQTKENEKQAILALQSLGPPSFIKKKFKSSTYEKFKMLSGKYFGC